MRVIADLHIHSRFSRATSKALTVDNLEKYAGIKGVDLLGTGDFTHPSWLEELKKELKEENGILKTKTGFNFILQAEVSNIYSQDGKLRKIHNVVLAKNFSIVEQINELLAKKGNLKADGRPIFGSYSCCEMVEDLKKIDKDIEIISAHIWTPWFSLFGSMSGFDKVEDCYKDQTKHIHALETGLSCYDAKTEVLTDKGWKKFSDLKYTDKVCTLNIKTDVIEFQNPQKIVAYDYKGKMYKLKTKRIDLLVTPNHKLLYSHCDFRKSAKFSLKEAELLFRKSKRFKKDGIWIGKDVKYFVLPAVKIKHGSRHYKGLRKKREKNLPIKNWLKFFGFWLAEGWTSQGKNGDYNVCLSSTNLKIIFRMKQILESFGYNTFYDKRNYTIRVRDYQLFSYLKKFGKCYDKFVPLDIKTLSKDLLQILLNYYIKGDGHVYGRSGKGLSATTTSVKLRDDLQEIALKIGISAYYKIHNKKGTLFISPSQKKTYKQRNDSWVIYFIRQNKHTVIPSYISKYNYIEGWVDFNGEVYCVSVPNKVIYVRRNGVPIWCGNSDPAMNWRLSSLDKYALVSSSDLHSFWPWRIGREATIFDLKELTYKDLINAIRTKQGLAMTVEFWPHEGKYHYTGHRFCNVCLSPKEALKVKDICPKCGKRLTIGVAERVEVLADRAEGYKPKGAVPFKNLIPLSELIGGVLKSEVGTKKVWEQYYKIISAFKNEMNVLLEVEESELKKVTTEKIAAVIIKNRNQKIPVKAGYDGVYGKPVFSKDEIQDEEELITKPKHKQKSLSEFS